MNEEQWLSCNHPEDMLDFLVTRQEGVGERKLRLFVVACARAAWEAIEDPRSRSVLEVVERFVDGLATAEELELARAVADEAARAGMGAGFACSYAASARVTDAAFITTNPDTTYYDPDTGAVYYDFTLAGTADYSFAQAEAWSAGRAAQADVLRDLCGNPFRERTPIVPSLLTWNGAAVVRLAQTAHEERTLPWGTLYNPRLLVLADALEEAGSTDAGLLEHLRSGRKHWRGCWAVDAVLGKE